jgi:cell division protein DivIC
MVKKKKKYTVKTKGRMFIIFLFFGAIISTLSYTLLANLKQVNDMKKELTELKKEKVSLLEQEEATMADIKRLSDPLYVARYAREKYFYSKDGELILRFKD